MIVQVTTHPFGSSGSKPREVLEGHGFQVRYNPFHRRLKTPEVPELVEDCHALLAGTEPYPAQTLARAKDLKVISRVGVGFDNVDVDYCRENGIAVTYTPEAPADGVAELTVCQILNLLRKVNESDRSVREKAWNRFLGDLVRDVRIGVLGVGRIGKRVIKLLKTFRPDLYACDLEPDEEFGRRHGIRWLDREALFRTCDLVSIHVPLCPETIGLVGRAELAAMRRGSMVINTSRGRILDESALLSALTDRQIAGAALDVFSEEPYEGPLTSHDNVVLTAHMGASAHGSRYLMELGAAEDCVRVLTGQEPVNPVPGSVPTAAQRRTRPVRLVSRSQFRSAGRPSAAQKRDNE